MNLKTYKRKYNNNANMTLSSQTPTDTRIVTTQNDENERKIKLYMQAAVSVSIIGLSYWKFDRQFIPVLSTVAAYWLNGPRQLLSSSSPSSSQPLVHKYGVNRLNNRNTNRSSLKYWFSLGSVGAAAIATLVYLPSRFQYHPWFTLAAGTAVIIPCTIIAYL